MITGTHDALFFRGFMDQTHKHRAPDNFSLLSIIAIDSNVINFCANWNFIRYWLSWVLKNEAVNQTLTDSMYAVGMLLKLFIIFACSIIFISKQIRKHVSV